ncbi:MAG: efflux RND transporter periplasmic adaptor subunit [Parvibaculum sp.]|uniref:efflux RND transporter periplasmic adaptor subunit n=1 Tax=Parvibaculum sp. TaxID=2024848 RepID=UPI0025E88EB3|nr:efflux RND transporter periplasmic adaptor subunit [Parvibaculum sp.]MCE9650403.1 efflux RND transporter periplasmic adaptor subunit [Parvibaculum sp.]
MNFGGIREKVWHTLPSSYRNSPPILRWGLAAVATLILLAGIWYAVSSESGGTRYKTEAVETGNIEQTVTALGALQPKDYVDVGAQVSGTLEVVHVKIGDIVKKGDLLAEVDPTVYEATVAADKAKLKDLDAQIEGQEAQLVLAQIQNKRNQSLLKIDAVSKDAADTSAALVKQYTAAIASTKAQVEQAQSTLDGDEANLSYTKIYAPMSGTVTSQTTLQGQTLNNRQAAPTIMQIADLTTMTVKAQVAEADVSKLKDNMPVYFTTLGMPDRKWRSTVRQILPTPETVNDVILYNALIDVANTDQALMTSMTAQVFFVLGSAENVPIVPVAALRPSKSGEDGAYRVLVMNGSRPKMTEVKIGLMNRISAQVISGLSVGDVVVTGTESTAAKPAQSSGGLGGRRGPRL